ncbi:MAG TPA: PAS domain-containing protein, partial [Stenomitos sp.]
MQQSAKGWFAGDGTNPPLMGLHVASPQTVADDLVSIPELGPFDCWPPHLKNAFGILSQACSPMFFVWNCPPTGEYIYERILFYNTAYLTLIQATLFSATDASLPVVFEMHHWQALWNKIQGDVEQVLTTGSGIQRCEPFDAVYQLQDAYRWSYSPVWDEKGQIAGVFVTGYWNERESMGAKAEAVHCESLHEIGDRLQSQSEQRPLLEVLATERARFEAVLRQMPEGVLIADAASGKLVLSNERAQQILHHSYTLNLPLETYRQAVPFEVCHANGQRYALEDYPLGRSLRNGEVVTHEEMELRHVDGGRTIISANSAPILDANGDITAAVVVIQDITDRKQAEAALRQNEERLRLAQQAAGAGLWDWDIAANQVAWSEAYYRLYGIETI